MSENRPTFVFVAGSTETARIDGISAAGANPDVLEHTPSADLEIVQYGAPVQAPVTPVSPSGCPTPAVMTRAVRKECGFDMVGVDAGLARPTAAPTVKIGGTPGEDIREETAVSESRQRFEQARKFGRGLPASELWIGETIPGGTTTALAVLTALGERGSVSSSLPENPIELKEEVVAEALETSGVTAGELAADPMATLRAVGDPVLCVITGLVSGAIETETAVTLAGGTQMAAVAALVRHAGLDNPLSIATTSFVADDETANIRELAHELSVELTVTNPGFDRQDHPALNAYVAGEAKEGVGMGGALALADRAGVPMATIRERIIRVYDRLLADEPEATP
jgi:uncharacterized protein (TIGR00303 family)